MPESKTQLINTNYFLTVRISCQMVPTKPKLVSCRSQGRSLSEKQVPLYTFPQRPLSKGFQGNNCLNTTKATKSDQWFLTFLMLKPFNTVSSSCCSDFNYKLISLLFHNCNVTTAMNQCEYLYLPIVLGDLCKLDTPRRVTTHRLSQTKDT